MRSIFTTILHHKYFGCIILAAARDHVKDNVRRMREIQAKCKQRQEEQAAVPVKPLYKPDKYEHIPPKVTMYMKVSCTCVNLLSL